MACGVAVDGGGGVVASPAAAASASAMLYNHNIVLRMGPPSFLGNSRALSTSSASVFHKIGFIRSI
eukprot:m.33243 g.33243  ORF g.33243 m.33243 type:complete len:66 (+) comp7171_c0_seq1:2753-2950(+)